MSLLIALLLASAWQWQLGPGFAPPAIPSDNPMAAGKVSLGARLFAEPRLSVNGTTSCASCHDPAHAFADPRPVSIGATGEPLATNAPSIVNAAWRAAYGWRPGGETSLEQQLRRPLFNRAPVELGIADHEDEILARLAADATWRDAFNAAFGEDPAPITIDHVIAALAAYVRSLTGGRSAFDRHVFGGDHTALGADARRGLDLFYSSRLGCGGCHGGLLFDGPWKDAAHPRVQAAVAQSVTGAGAFRVPSLRNVAVTAPYFHDGRAATLDAVLDRYAEARRFTLSPRERAELLAFLVALTEPPWQPAAP